MNKEELRKEFYKVYLHSVHLESVFDWFYGRMLAKDKEIEHWEGKSKEHFESFLLLRAKIKAADQLITEYGRWSDSISWNLKQALEHYKSLK